MFAVMESRLTAIISDGLSTRPHAKVHRSPAPAGAPLPGEGLVLVSLAEATGLEGFEIGTRVTLRDGGPVRTRRIVPVGFRAFVDVTVQPSDSTPAKLAEARTLALDDMALIVHMLDDVELRDGGAFATNDGDPGFAVHAFVFQKATFQRDLVGPSVSGRLEYSGRADIWPPAPVGPAGEIQSVDALIAPLPLTIAVDDPGVPAGGSTQIRVRTGDLTRLTDGGPRATASLAVSVQSDVAPADRGSIPTGEAGPETGLRLITAAGPVTVLFYQAPAIIPATRVEYVAVHLATADGRRGVLLGTAAIRLLGGQ